MSKTARDYVKATSGGMLYVTTSDLLKQPKVRETIEKMARETNNKRSYVAKEK